MFESESISDIVRIMKEIVKLDSLDRRILGELQRDGAQSNGELAERRGKHGSVVLAPRQSARGGRRTDENVCSSTRHGSDRASTSSAISGSRAIRPNIPRCSKILSGTRIASWNACRCRASGIIRVRVVATDVADYEAFLMQRLLRNEAVAGAASHFALRAVKYQTAVPLPGE